MKKRKHLIWVLIIFTFNQLTAQEFRNDSLKSIYRPPIVHFFPDSTQRKAPDAYFNKRAEELRKAKPKDKSKNLTTITYNPFVIRYSSPTAQNVKDVFTRATEIWAKYIVTGRPIVFDVRWEELPNRVLGSAGPSENFINVPNSPDSSKVYPIALTEKLQGRDQNYAGGADVSASFNSKFSDWYIGTEGFPSPSQIDLLSVVLHEIGHGLGFISFLDVDTSSRTAGFNYQMIYDKYLQDFQGEAITDINFYPNLSNKIFTLVTSDSLYQSSPAILQLNTTRARIYAPRNYSEGSSISHVHNVTYPAGDANALMTPTIAYGETTRELGPIVKGLFKDMGWTKAGIYPQGESSRVKNSNGYTFVAKALFSKEFNDTITNVQLYVSTGNKNNYTLRTVTKQGDEYFYHCPHNDTITAIRYYWLGNDAAGNQVRYPTQPNSYDFISILPNEVIPPTITADPIDYVFAKQPFLAVNAISKDNQAVQRVEFIYKTNRSTIESTTSIPVNTSNLSAFSDFIQINDLQLNRGDTIYYKLKAYDIALSPNTSTFPNSGWKAVPVIGPKAPLNAYGQTFENLVSTDFFLGGWSINTPTGFTGKSLNTAHPYTNAKFGKYSDAILLRPIILQANGGQLSFDEIVISEPDYDFFIIQASKDSGQTWVDLITPYSASSNPKWVAIWQNPQLAVSPAAISTRNINLLNVDGFNPGDQIILRFRLFIDNVFNSWGCFIDNLKIQGTNQPITSLEPANSPPTISTNKIYLRNDLPIGTQIPLQFEDPDNDLLSINMVEGGPIFKLGANNQLAIIANPNEYSDVDSIKIRVSDGILYSIKAIPVVYCEANSILTGTISNLTKTYSTNSSFQSTQQIIGQSRIKYQALHGIELSPNFSTEKGVIFESKPGFGCPN